MADDPIFEDFPTEAFRRHGGEAVPKSDYLLILHALTHLLQVERMTTGREAHDEPTKLGKYSYVTQPSSGMYIYGEADPLRLPRLDDPVARHFGEPEGILEEISKSDDEADKRIESIREALDRSRALGEQAQKRIDSLKERSRGATA